MPNLLGAVEPASVLPARTLDVARRLRHFVVETPKAARAFLKSLPSEHALQDIAFAELNEHTPAQDVAALLAPVLAGKDVALLSDAGCPGVADPGALLVAAAHRAGVVVVPLVGPSALLLALMASGMNGQNFVFHGYLPVRAEARAAALRALDAASRTQRRHAALHRDALSQRGDRGRRAGGLPAADAILRGRRPDLAVRADRQPHGRADGGRRASLRLRRRPAMFLLGGD